MESAGRVVTSLLRTAAAHAAEDRQLEILPETVHVAEADLTQPPTLFLDRREDVGGPVRPFEEFVLHLFPRHLLAALPAPGVQVLGHRVVEQLFPPRRRAGDVLAVEEQAALAQQP